MSFKKENIVDIELTGGSIHRSFLNHAIGRNDDDADWFGVRVFRGGSPVNLEGGSVQGFFKQEGRSPIAITSGNRISGNLAEVLLPQACYNYDGQFTLAIKIINTSEGVTGTMRIVDGVVENTNVNGAVAPTGTIPTYQEILAVYEQMVAAKEGSLRFDITQELSATELRRVRTNARVTDMEDIAEKFDATKNYSIGDYCFYNADLYRFTSAHSAGAFNPNHVTSVDLAVELKNEKTARENEDTTINDKIGYTELPTTEQTLTGAIAEHENDIAGITEEIGNTELPTTAQTLTGAIAEHETDIGAIETEIGNTPLPTTAQTLTGAIAEHETDIGAIETEIGNTELPTTAQTLTGAIAEHETDIGAIETEIGNTELPTTAQTLTGAIAEHETDIGAIETEIGNTELPTTAQTLTGAIEEHETDIQTEINNRTNADNELKSAFNQETQLIADGILSLDSGTTTQYDVDPVNYTLVSTGMSANSGAETKVFPVTAGKEYTIHFVGGNHRRYGFTNTIADGSALNDYHSLDTMMPSTIDVTAPTGYAYLVVYYSTYAYDNLNGKSTVYITSDSNLQKQITKNSEDIEDIQADVESLQETTEELNEDILQNKKQYKQFSTSSGSTEYRCSQTDSNIGDTISLTASTNWSVWKIDCSKISMIFAFLRHPASSNNALWVFVDKDEKIVKTGRNSVLETKSEWYDITSVPSSAKYVYIFTNRGSSTAYLSEIYYSEYVDVDQQFAGLTDQNLDRMFLIRKIIPSYYWAFSENSSSLANNEWLNQKIASIPTGKSFIFVTDTHWETNNQKSIELIDYIKQKTGIDTVLFGGDAMNGENDKYLGVGRLRSDINPFVDAFGKSFVVVPGNHDLNAYKLIDQSPTTEQINNTLIPYTYEESILTGHLQPYIVKDRGYNLASYASGDNLTNLTAYMGLHYYIDDTKNKIRYIVLNSGNTYSGIVQDIFGVTNAPELLLQYDWYAEALRTIPDGYDVIVGIHEFLYGIDSWYPAMRARGVMSLLNARMKKTEGTMYLNPTSEIAQNTNLTSYFAVSTHTYDFSGCGDVGKGIIMNGHWHIDMAIASDKTLYTEYGQNININSGSSYSGVLAITTQCDRKVTSPNQYQSETVADTVTEQCFDIVTIASDGIHCTRIGAGSDRVFYYAT